MALIYKIITLDLWQAAQARGVVDGMPVDHADGYMHFSSAAQVHETARKHFAGQSNLILLAVSADDLGADLRWDVSRGGALFPHLYAPLPVAAVASARPLATGADGNPLLPDLDP